MEQSRNHGWRGAEFAGGMKYDGMSSVVHPTALVVHNVVRIQKQKPTS